MKSNSMAWRFLASAGLTIGLVAPAALMAQRGGDRGLTQTRNEDRTAPVPPPPPSGKVTLMAVGAPVELKANWLIQPLASSSPGNNGDMGLLAGFRNTNRFGNVPWQVDVRGVRRERGGVSHGRWQLGAEINPVVSAVAGVPLLAAVTAMHAQTVSVGTSDQVAGELDLALIPDSTLTVGGILYYDWSRPQGVSRSSGATFGIVGYYEKDRFTLVPEYDFSSAFNDGDFYSIAASMLLYTTPNKTRVRLKAAWEKGDNYSLRLQFGIPSNRISSDRFSR